MLGAMPFSINDTHHNAILHRAMLGTGIITVAFLIVVLMCFISMLNVIMLSVAAPIVKSATELRQLFEKSSFG